MGMSNSKTINNPYIFDWNKYIEKIMNKNSNDKINIENIYEKLIDIQMVNGKVSMIDIYNKIKNQLNENQRKQVISDILWNKIYDNCGVTIKNQYENFNKTIEKYELDEIEKIYLEYEKNKTEINKKLNIKILFNDVNVSSELNRLGLPSSLIISENIKIRFKGNPTLENLINILFTTENNISDELINRWIISELSKNGYNFEFIKNENIVIQSISVSDQIENKKLIDGTNNIIIPWNIESLDWKKLQLNGYIIDKNSIISFKDIKDDDEIIYITDPLYKHYIKPIIGKYPLPDFNKSIKFNTGTHYLISKKYPNIIRLKLIIKNNDDDIKINNDQIINIDENKNIKQNNYNAEIKIDWNIDMIPQDILIPKGTKLIFGSSDDYENDINITNDKWDINNLIKIYPTTGLIKNLNTTINFDIIGIYYLISSVHSHNMRIKITVIDNDPFNNILPILPKGLKYKQDFIQKLKLLIKCDISIKNLMYKFFKIKQLPNYSIILKESSNDLLEKLSNCNSIEQFLKIIPINNDKSVFELLCRDIGNELLLKAIRLCDSNYEPDLEFRTLCSWYELDTDYAFKSLCHSLTIDGNINDQKLQELISYRLLSNEDLKIKLLNLIKHFRH